MERFRRRGRLPRPAVLALGLAALGGPAGRPPQGRGRGPRRPGAGPSQLGLGGGAPPGELDGVVPAVGARVVLGQRVAALPADPAEREALLAGLAGAGLGPAALHCASLGAHGNPRSSASRSAVAVATTSKSAITPRT